MMKMKITIDEEKVKNDSEYTVDEMYKKIDDLAKRSDITKKDKDGLYVGNNDRHDLANFGRIIIALKKCEWFMQSVGEWLWDENGEVEDVADYFRVRGKIV